MAPFCTVVLVLIGGTETHAQLNIEPVINWGEGAGPAENNFGIAGIVTGLATHSPTFPATPGDLRHPGVGVVTTGACDTWLDDMSFSGLQEDLARCPLFQGK